MLKKILMAIGMLVLIVGGLFAYYMNSIGIWRVPQYDTQAPAILEMTHPAKLVMTKTNGFIHKEGIPAATEMLQAMAAQMDWQLYVTENAATHNAKDLAKFDAVIWNNTSGDILTEQQRHDFKAWLSQGGQWLGLHAAGGDPSYDWGWYRDSLIAAQFFGHTMTPQFQDADVLVADAKHPFTSHLPVRWNVKQEEWYAFDRNPRDTGSTILLALDEETYSTKESVFKEPTMPGEHPIAWTHSIGKGTVVYSAIGHTAVTYSNADYQKFIEQAIKHLLSQASLTKTLPVDQN